MPSLTRSAFVLVLGFRCLVLEPSLAARESNGTPAAKAFFAQGDAAAKAGKPADAAAAFRKAIDADPDFVDAHQRFIESTQRAEMPGTRTPTVPRLEQLYAQWARQQPKRAVYQWALGFLSTDSTKADAFFRAALKLDPSFARAHFLLARNADLRGDWAAQRDYLKAAAEANPDEPRYLLKYAHANKRSDAARFRELATSVVQKFPDTQAAAEALYNLADASSDPERRAYFDQLRAKYPPDRFGYSSLALSDFYEELTAPSEALSVAQEMSKAFPASKTWARRVELQQAMVRATALVAERKFDEALVVIDKTEPPAGSHGTTLALLKAEVAASAGHTDRAYSTLVESVAAAPDQRVEAALLKYGTALHKAAREIDADVWRVRDAKASPATPFQLAGDRGGRTVQLSDYRGRVVLLAFWFPG
jgi:tetratricopeptide (TPR) repeat protein